MFHVILKKIIDFWNFKKFKGASFEKIILGPEYNRNFIVKFPEQLKIGCNTVLNGDCFINAMGGVNIGKYCHIAKGLTIYSHNHNYRSDDYIPYDDRVIMKPVCIGDCVWIGCNVTIAPGTEIGDGCIVSSGSVVFGKIPAHSVIRGNPAIVIGSRDVKTFEKLYSEGKFK